MSNGYCHMCGREVADGRPRVSPGCECAEDMDDLRRSLIYAINHAGGKVSDDCSTEFLCLGADQIKLYVEKMRGILGEALPTLRRLLNHADPVCSICGGQATADGSRHRKTCTVSRIDALLARP